MDRRLVLWKLAVLTENGVVVFSQNIFLFNFVIFQ
jgi:hypothetical protein